MRFVRPTNGVRQLLRPARKIFFLGFNKCGTSALHAFLRANGIWSVHYNAPDGSNLALEIEARLHDREALRQYLDRWMAYSDLASIRGKVLVEGNRHHATYRALFPEAYFVLNDRDEEAWLRSRTNHFDGRFLQQCMTFYGLDRERTIERWRAERRERTAEILRAFAGDPRFLHFRIDRDPVTALTTFLEPAYRLDPARWRVVNETAPRSAA